MKFPYPHYDAEFCLGVVIIGLLAAVALPAARLLPARVGVPLAFVPLVLLLGWCAWTWYRVRR